jgi:ATP-dependent DNA helicase RecG
MLTLTELRALQGNLEADFTERTESLKNSDKIGEAICAFANDLADRRRTGVLFLGLRDDGSCAGATITDELLRTLLGFRDGRIIPIPSITVRREDLDGCDVAIVEVQPSEYPPVRYRGRVCVRRGPQRGFATPEEERRLIEKRRAGVVAFDQNGVPGSSLDDLDIALFEREYLPSAVSGESLRENNRLMPERLAALRFVTRDGVPTITAILVIGKNARNWIPGAYVQFVRYDGTEVTDPIRSQSEINTPIAEQLRRVDEVLAANISAALDELSPNVGDGRDQAAAV